MENTFYRGQIGENATESTGFTSLKKSIWSVVDVEEASCRSSVKFARHLPRRIGTWSLVC